MPTPTASKKKSYTTWEKLQAVLGRTRRSLLYGPPAVGKTYNAVTLGLKTGQRALNLTLTPEMSATVILGHYIPEGTRFLWHDGIGIRAWKEGARLVLNEIDQASGDVTTLLHSILDDPKFAELTLPTGEVVRPHPNFQVVATMNGVPEDLPFALRDRFPVCMHVAEIHPKALDCLSPDLRELARKSCHLTDPKQRISFRALIEFDHLRTELDSEMAMDIIFDERAYDVKCALDLTKSTSH